MINKNKLVAPVLKWVGGKRQLIESLILLLPEQKINSYCEPFVGGGALLFHLQPDIAFINDINDELIRVYNVIKDDVEELIKTLLEFKNESEYFYNIRDLDRNRENYNNLSNVYKAARILYLNKTCYNGLYRVNSSGEFNSPFGNYRNPNIVNSPTLRAVSSYFNKANIRFYSTDYANILNDLPEETFLYLDPPYDPISDTSNFTGYSRGGFTRMDQIRLKHWCDELNERGFKFMLSNSATEFIFNLYADYNITIVQAKRAINSDSAKRGEIEEVVVRNYGE